MSKAVEAGVAAGMVNDGDTLVVDGITYGCPEELCLALEQRFLQTGHPRQLTLAGPGGSGDTRGRGIDHLAHEGLISRFAGSYLNLCRKLARLVQEEKIEAYLIPLGGGCQLLREIAAGRPGLFTPVGLGTYIDPRQEGGRLNSLSRGDEFVPEVITLGGHEYLWYKSYRIDVAFIRGTTADTEGNVTMEKEAGLMNALDIAMATKKGGGKVIVQVERLAAKGSLNPKDVRVPSILVDAVVVARPENHPQTWREQYNPALSGEIRAPQNAAPYVPLDYRKVIARRALLELVPGMVVNLGAGLPEFVASVSWEEGIQDWITFIVEGGMIGGVPGFGMNFNTATNAACMLSCSSIVDFFDGGGHDFSCVGFAQVDRAGNVNVSKLRDRVPGIGGFLDVAPTAKRRLHCGAFTSGESDLRLENGRLRIVRDEEIVKFVEKVDQISVSGAYALEVGQPVKIITERAVFEWCREGLVLKEVAPGIDVREDILNRMAFRPLVSEEPKLMPGELFQEAPLGLAKRFFRDSEGRGPGKKFGISC